ncbi:hypothetical protein AMECASPLE_002709 [Ameca splendens]|uniref:Uncharacterized protein n=1 Tax=Ameca splendens TaxID=208324 RepID=A0ABV0ZWH0_9TELE
MKACYFSRQSHGSTARTQEVGLVHTQGLWRCYCECYIYRGHQRIPLGRGQEPATWGRQGGMKARGRGMQSTSFFYVLIYSVLTFPLTLLLFLLKIKNTVSCFSSRSSVFEHNAPHGEEGLVQKANTNSFRFCGSVNDFSIFSLHDYIYIHFIPYGHLKTVIPKAFRLLFLLVFFK